MASRIADQLVKSGVLSRADITYALEVQKLEGSLGPLEDLLVREGFVSAAEIMRAKSSALQIPYVELRDAFAEPEAKDAVPFEMAVKYKAFPMKVARHGAR